ncbi:MAG: SusC/RagA family TonB-linked outer membrane protein [Mediterranea sp.]|jgi:TonB-linked SusC/RagA family outer membrane protein|nr:SusC/RagA family TonB-linked outer membrane protein [Mediterranea sp.]
MMSLFAVLFIVCTAVAQTVNVKGFVTSEEDGLPVVGASILLKGSTLGTITNVDGEFELKNLPGAGGILQISYIGMIPQEVPVKPQVRVVLRSNAEVLEEVVVTAQGLTRKEKSIGYGMQNVDGEKLSTVRQTDLGNALAGKVAGARFSGSSGATFDSGTIKIRGSQVFTTASGSEPIYVVDGSITNKNAVNMDDIATLSVLKGAAATALYGSRGTDGAVIITTKQAAEGKGRIEVSHTLQLESYYNHFKMQKLYGGGSYGIYGERYGKRDGDKYDTMSPEYLYGVLGKMQNADGSYYYDYDSDESWGARFDPNVKVASALYWDPTSPKYGIADPWVHRLDIGDMFRTGMANTTNVAFSKAGKDYTTRISFTNSYRTGVQDNSDAVRRFLAIKSSFKPIEWLNVSLDYKYTYRRNHNAAQEGYGGARSMMYAYTQWSQTNVKLSDYKDYLRPDGTWRTWNISSKDNLRPRFHDSPYAVFNEANVAYTEQWNVFTGDAEIQLPFNLKAGFRAIGNMKNYNAETTRSAGALNFTSYYEESQYHTRDLTLQGRLTWADRFLHDRLTVDAAAFIEERNYNYGRLKGNTADGLAINKWYNLAASVNYPKVENERQHFITRSVYGTATAGLDDTYFIDASLRNDWDSRLVADNNSYLYAGLSGSLMLSKFTQAKAPWLNYWKLRASLAQVGSTMDAYSTYPDFTTGTKYNTMTTLYQPVTELNPNIQPTISTSYEVGTEFRLFNKRLWGDINFYRRDSKNQILNLSVAPQSGYSSRQINAGLIRNEGIEISLGVAPIQTRNLEWDIDINWAKNVNRLIELHEDMPTYRISYFSLNNYYYYRATVGKKMGVISALSRWERNEEGALILTKTTSDDWGGGYRPTWKTGDEEELGCIQPDWFGGLSTSLRYKKLRLSASFDFSVGGKVVSISNMNAVGSGISTETVKLNKNGVNEREPISKGGGVFVKGVDSETGESVEAWMNAYNYYHYQTRYDYGHWIYDASYVKMRELSLNYDLTSLVKKTSLGLTNASISFVATNPLLIYSGVPNLDASELGGVWYEGGQAGGTRTFGLTVKLGF